MMVFKIIRVYFKKTLIKLLPIIVIIYKLIEINNKIIMMIGIIWIYKYPKWFNNNNNIISIYNFQLNKIMMEAFKILQTFYSINKKIWFNKSRTKIHK